MFFEKKDINLKLVSDQAYKKHSSEKQLKYQIKKIVLQEGAFAGETREIVEIFINKKQLQQQNSRQTLSSKRHPWHILLPSALPISTSISLFFFLLMFICYLHHFEVIVPQAVVIFSVIFCIFDCLDSVGGTFLSLSSYVMQWVCNFFFTLDQFYKHLPMLSSFLSDFISLNARGIKGCENYCSYRLTGDQCFLGSILISWEAFWVVSKGGLIQLYFKVIDWPWIYVWLLWSFRLFIDCIYAWLRAVNREATIHGHHTFAVEKNIRLGVALFIVSEIMFFFSFFWAFFHSSLNPSIWIGGIWPPKGIVTFNPYSIPLLNTVILLSSGVTLTFAHHALFLRKRHWVTAGLVMTILYALFFTGLQIYEYKTAPFCINDSIYGSCFYMLTGFHGFHVILGTIALIVTLFRHLRYELAATYHVGFETTAWYWHFVDVVWIFLYLAVYCWGS